MSYNPPSSRVPPSHLRSASHSTNASPALLSRINEKKAELASLKELQALSAGLADQMEQLEQKLGTLSDGTEAVAAVLSNWHNVLRAISMASCKFLSFTIIS
jgi:DASH complex subunit DAD2